MPQHLVTIGQPIAVGRYEVTFTEWDACVADGGCNDYKPRDEKWDRGNRPVIHVDWDHAQSYVSWLSRKTGKPYRLLSEAEWEYAARAGTTTPYYWGKDPRRTEICAYANAGPLFRCADKTLPVGSLRPNSFGLYDMSGNVLEWTADCWNDTYDGAPSQGSVWQEGNCKMRVLRGGSWYEHARMDIPGPFRSAARHYMWGSSGAKYIGFRVARTMAVAPDPYRGQHLYREQRPSLMAQNSFRTCLQPWTENGMFQVCNSFFTAFDGIEFGRSTVSQTIELWKDVPHPVAYFPSVFQL